MALLNSCRISIETAIKTVQQFYHVTPGQAKGQLFANLVKLKFWGSFFSLLEKFPLLENINRFAWDWREILGGLNFHILQITFFPTALLYLFMIIIEMCNAVTCTSCRCSFRSFWSLSILIENICNLDSGDKHFLCYCA